MSLLFIRFLFTAANKDVESTKQRQSLMKMYGSVDKVRVISIMQTKVCDFLKCMLLDEWEKPHLAGAGTLRVYIITQFSADRAARN